MSKHPGVRADAITALAEVFREHGYEGATLTRLSAGSGLGKGSLYHFFPGGKDEMVAVVLEEIDQWFTKQVFEPLRHADDPAAAIRSMMITIDAYFRSGRRTCLVGAFALSDVRDFFALQIAQYFAAWRDALSVALQRLGHAPPDADDMAEDIVAGIQGALVAARALDDEALFLRALRRMERRLDLPLT
ncbi:MAG: TetR/AcrR family transcriptional regulator [Hyphomicrobiales bacterium]|nr:TetR/AcrR family transcriptional regulator [Hyphomicrobiales bacterium]MDE2115977.1 TetR/AcrR family transcriptional regulator [Hyphomicrobiales bacterium]